MSATYKKARRATVKEKIIKDKEFKKLNTKIQELYASSSMLRDSLIGFFDYAFTEDPELELGEEDLIKAAKFINIQGELNLPAKVVEVTAKDLYKDLLRLQSEIKKDVISSIDIITELEESNNTIQNE